MRSVETRHLWIVNSPTPTREVRGLSHRSPVAFQRHFSVYVLEPKYDSVEAHSLRKTPFAEWQIAAPCRWTSQRHLARGRRRADPLPDHLWLRRSLQLRSENGIPQKCPDLRTKVLHSHTLPSCASSPPICICMYPNVSKKYLLSPKKYLNVSSTREDAARGAHRESPQLAVTYPPTVLSRTRGLKFPENDKGNDPSFRGFLKSLPS